MVLVCTSCGRNHPIRTLSHIEAILDSDPAAAQASLDSIDATTLKGQHLARYAMLKTQADYKCYVDIPSDSLIRIATDWYGTRHKDWHAAMSWYSLGCVSDLNGNDTIAIDAYLKAKDLFPDSLTRSYALCLQKIGNHYTRHHLFHDALSAYSSSRSISSVLTDSVLISQADYRTAQLHLYMENYDTAYKEFMDLMGNPFLTRTQSGNCLLEIAKIKLFYTQECDSAIYYSKLHIQNTEPRARGAGYDFLAQAYQNKHEYDSAYHYYEKSLSVQSDIYSRCGCYKGLLDLAVMKGEYELSHEYSEKYSEALDSIALIRNQDKITELRMAHADEMNDLRLKETRRTVALISLMIVTAIIGACASLAYRRGKRVRQYYIDKCDETRTAGLSLVQEATDDEIWTYCLTLFSSTPSHALLESLKDNIRPIVSNERSMVNHDIIVCFAELHSHELNKGNEMNRKEFCYCVLSRMGADSTVIQEILCLSDSNCRTMRSRIKSKYSDSIVYFS